MSTPTIAWLAKGKLHVKAGGAPVQVIESRFGESVRARAVRMEQRTAWKTQGTGARFMRGMPWSTDLDESTVRVAITGLAAGPAPGELYYALETDAVGGVFLVPAGGGEERRIFHSADKRVRHLAASLEHDAIACSLTTKAGIAGIAVMRADGSEILQVTEGDSVDLLPRWIPDAPRELVFQSAGIGRDEQGLIGGIGPFSIQRLSVESGSMTCRSTRTGAPSTGWAPRGSGSGSARPRGSSR